MNENDNISSLEWGMGSYEHEMKSMDEATMLTNVWNWHGHSTRKVIMEEESLLRDTREGDTSVCIVKLIFNETGTHIQIISNQRNTIKIEVHTFPRWTTIFNHNACILKISLVIFIIMDGVYKCSHVELFYGLGVICGLCVEYEHRYELLHTTDESWGGPKELDMIKGED